MNQNSKSKGKNILYNIAREYAKKVLTSNLGKVIEEDDKLFCYVDKRKCEKQTFTYTIGCNVINESNVGLAKAYGLDKPIYYIIDGLNFRKKQVYIFGYNNANVIVKNCNFAYGLYVSVNGTCTIENSYIRGFERLMICANNLTIKDINVQNELKYSTGLNISFDADNELTIINSQIGRLKEGTNVCLTAGNILVINNSKIAGSCVNCETNKIVNHNYSLLISDKHVNVKAVNFEPIRVVSRNINLNDNVVSSRCNSVILKQITNPLSLKRLELIELLKQVKDTCEKVNLEDELKYKDELNNRSVIKTYKKG